MNIIAFLVLFAISTVFAAQPPDPKIGTNTVWPKTTTIFTAGSVGFADSIGRATQDNANFFWDDTNKRLGIGNASPLTTLNITAPTTQLRLSYDLTHFSDFTVNSSGDITFAPSSLLSVFTGGISLSPTTSSTTGVIFKGSTRFIHNYADATSDGQNLFIGLNSGNFTMSPGGGASTLASYNTGIGNATLGALTTGYQNIAIATSALGSLTTGKENIGIGYAAMVANTTGNRNTVIGTAAGVNIDGGGANTIIGYNTGGGITSGSRNTIIGSLVSGLSSGLTDNIILANGAGTIKAQHDGSNWTLTGGTIVTKVLSTTPSALTYASPTSVDVTLGNVFTVTTVNATGSVTFNATAGGTAGQRIVFIITNDATSAKTITFGTNFVPNGTLTPSGAGKVATIEFISNGTSFYELARTVLP